MNNVPGVGIDGGHWGPGPRVFVERKKAAEKKSNSIRQKEYSLKGNFQLMAAKAATQPEGWGQRWRSERL